MSHPLVVHRSRGRKPWDIYIGRGSPWGNPFVIGRDGDRLGVIVRYSRWLVMQPALMDRLPELRGKVLGCHCAPLPCHGDVLATWANSGVRPVSAAHGKLIL